MNDATDVTIQSQDFDLGAEVARLHTGQGDVGAVVSFLGTVRDVVPAGSTSGTLLGMELEHYPGMTERAIEAMVNAARERFDIQGVRVVHRVGRLGAGDQIVLVAVASRHRAAAFQACEFLMDFLKTQAPFWKKELTTDGGQWVDARVQDDEALRRWGVASDNAR